MIRIAVVIADMDVGVGDLGSNRIHTLIPRRNRGLPWISLRPARRTKAMAISNLITAISTKHFVYYSLYSAALGRRGPRTQQETRRRHTASTQNLLCFIKFIFGHSDHTIFFV